MKFTKKLCLLLSMILVVSLMTGCQKNASSEEQGEKKDLVIMYTNDVHCAVDNNIGYEGVALIKDLYSKLGNEVMLVDCGDYIQGGLLGSITNGEAIIRLMNNVGYDAATLGNHEFEFGVQALLDLSEKAEFKMISCNFEDINGKRFFDPYTIIERNGKKVAFVGVSTPETFTSSNPKYFMDENDNLLYSFCQGGENGEDLYKRVQETVDDARNEGADYVILVAHLGSEENMENGPFSSMKVIENTSGIDAVLDAHTHETYEMLFIKNKNGEDVLLSQTGTGIKNIGILVIHPDGTKESKLIENESVRDQVEEEKALINNILDEFVGTARVPLWIYNPEDHTDRLVRKCECSAGDFCADAYRAISQADIAVVNGGGVRCDVPYGRVKRGDIINLNPYNNSICVVCATGQMIADALEIGASNLPEEYGGFLQVSGMSYHIDTSKKPIIKTDDVGLVTSIEGERRVHDILIGGEPIDLEKEYTVASTDYVILNYGDGNTGFKGCEIISSSIMTDMDSLLVYLDKYLNGVIPESYGNAYGDGRIVIE